MPEDWRTRLRSGYCQSTDVILITLLWEGHKSQGRRGGPPYSFFPDIDDAVSGGVENCQGRRFLAFISTLDRSPRHFIIERGRSATQFSWASSLVDGFWILFFVARACQCVPTHSS